jgi:hypothetical protein
MSSRADDQLPEAGRLPTGRLARTARRRQTGDTSDETVHLGEIVFRVDA